MVSPGKETYSVGGQWTGLLQLLSLPWILSRTSFILMVINLQGVPPNMANEAVLSLLYQFLGLQEDPGSRKLSHLGELH